METSLSLQLNSKDDYHLASLDEAETIFKQLKETSDAKS